MRSIWIAALIAACSSPAGFDVDVSESEIADEVGVEQMGETAPEVATDAAPCVQFDGAALRRWPSLPESFAEASAERWGFALPRGDECRLVVASDRSTLWAETRVLDVSGERKVAILVNPKDSIVEGHECDAQIRLVDALTHELGHVAGLQHPASEECELTRSAMCPQFRCESTMPTASEVAAAHHMVSPVE
jgi:hypothetical protein